MYTLAQAKQDFKTLDTMFMSFNQFDGVESSKYRRKELSGLIKKYVNKGVIERRDVGKVIELYTPGRAQYGMAPDISISLVDNKFSVCLDGLEGTIYGINEFIQEYSK